MLTISKIKKHLHDILGKKVKIFYYGGRNKKEIYSGVIFCLYRNIFSLKLDNGTVKSFGYCDILTKAIKICKI